VGAPSSAFIRGACADRPSPSQASRPPNIVFVLVDDLRLDDFGAAGHPFSQTPNIDRVAHEGARFLNAFATTPLCSPSRASFLTGQYAHTHTASWTTRRATKPATGRRRLPRRSRRRDTPRPSWASGTWGTTTPRPGFSHWVAMKGLGEAGNPKLNVDGQRIERQGNVTNILTEYATAFIRRPADKPFLLMLSHKALHPNYTNKPY
jgi:N-acetylglucosamine-6-sulfatase